MTRLQILLLAAFPVFLTHPLGATETAKGVASADLSVTKTDTPDPVNAMGISNLVFYTITVTNAGPSNAAMVNFSDPLPVGTTFRPVLSDLPAGWTCSAPATNTHGTVSCSIASLAPGTTVFMLTVEVDPTVPDGMVLSNTAMVTSATADPSPGNESATATTTVLNANALVSLTKTDAPDPVLPGGNLTYTITAFNNSTRDLGPASLSDTLPAGTTFISLTAPAGWTCPTIPAVSGTGMIVCDIAPWPPGSHVFTLVLQVAPSVPVGTVLDNSAQLNVFDGEEFITRITHATTQVLSPSAVSGTKSASGRFTPGSTVTYTVVLSNAGPGTQQDNPGNEFTDVLPAGLTLVSASATSGTAVATVGTNTVTWNGSIAASGSVTITITATVSPTATPGTTISNRGTIAYDADGNGTNEASGVTDNPATAGPDSTSFVVAADIPALDEVGLALLILLLGMGGAVMLRRRA